MKLLNKAVSVLLSAGVILTVPLGTGVFTQAAEASRITLVGSAPLGLQTDLTFPDWAGYVDDTLLMNNRYSFKAYKGQGEIYITCTGLTGVKLFVNGSSIDISQACKNNGKTYKLDISNLTVNGANTLQLNGYTPASGKINVKIPYPTVINGTAARVGADQDVLNLVDTIINNDIKYGFTSAELAIVKDGVMIKNTAYGTVDAYNQNGTRKTNSSKVTPETLYDLASNTKMYATNYALQKLVYEKKIDINDKVTKYFPDFRTDPTIQSKEKPTLP